MALNACSINSFTIDAGRCRNKFDDLIPILHPAPGAHKHGSHTGWTKGRPPAYFQGINRPNWPEEVPRQVPTELERITINVQFMGIRGMDTQQIVPRLDLVTVTDIHINPTTVAVNIENLKVTPHAKLNDD